MKTDPAVLLPLLRAWWATNAALDAMPMDTDEESEVQCAESHISDAMWGAIGSETDEQTDAICEILNTAQTPEDALAAILAI